MMGMTLELQLMIPEIEVPPVLLLLRSVLPILSFKILALPIPAVAMIVLPIIVLGAWFVTYQVNIAIHKKGYYHMMSLKDRGLQCLAGLQVLT